MSKQSRQKLIIALFIIIISILHYWGGAYNSPVHDFYRLLYFIPVIIAAMNFGFRGGVFTSIIVSLIYSPFILLTLGIFNSQAVNELLDVILFFAAGIIAGTLVEKKNLSLMRLDDELKRYILLENYTNSIIESIKSGVIAVNNDMLITMANQGAKDLMCIGTGCIGQNLSEAFACCESIKQYIYEAVSKNQPHENIEAALNGRDREIIIRINLYPLNYDNVRKGLVIIVDDITEMKKLQRELLRNEKLAALGELSTGVAHEIRNPLGIIKAIEQTMKNEFKDNPEAVKELTIIDEEIERANKVVKALMEFGRPSKGEKLCHSVDMVVGDVLTIAGKYIAQHGVTVEYTAESDTTAYIDKEQLKQAFINIIFNAVQAMPDGGSLKIRALKPDEQHIKVIFEDTGTGIEKENMDKIFDPFFTTRDEGTGLGLSIVHRIIEEHGGEISVSSDTGRGARFEIKIPVRRNEDK